jgi:hypothetical protein
MTPQALIVAYYLSRFDNEAYSALGFPGRQKTKAHQRLGEALSVNNNSLKNRRDDFDPLHGHRAGWYQYKLSEKMRNVVESFQDLDFSEMTDIVTEIISNKDMANDIGSAVADIDKSDKAKKKAAFVPRGITGENAELYFKEWHSLNQMPMEGQLHDRRHDGCGYDFLVENGPHQAFIEVKGLDQAEGGVSFTSKEWSVAEKECGNYYLVFVSNLSSDPLITIIPDPFHKLSASKYIYQPIQIKWNVSSSDLKPFVEQEKLP